ncbi:AraC family transcriptional regulator [Halomonas nitroreducens]|uniref:AraC family transcriptional regulator n=1 Tax=Halomonas nitroreducens TaxID=447425 RepID=A0A3S0R4G0_9GAMM|nr:AraC family transcriptional regulator [Halomonas nitroreducens]RTR07071.1 AraC family transcriptional regulator [Halomonas nitroreducens]
MAGQRDPQRFWRDPALPFMEARRVTDGRRVCYARHSHATFSIGAITGGRSTYWNQGHEEGVTPGMVVVMNPEEVHACNPVDDRPWSYDMLYLDIAWLADLQRELGAPAHLDLQIYTQCSSRHPALYRRLVALCDTLFAPDATRLARETEATALVVEMQHRLAPRMPPPGDHPLGLRRAADYIDAHCTEAIGLDDICNAAGLSRSYLVRRFKAHYGLTPHAFLTNRRIRLGRRKLRDGQPIAEVAADCGFADQAHFQRTFKRLQAATPGQYATSHTNK